jgi:hypothetical protein
MTVAGFASRLGGLANAACSVVRQRLDPQIRLARAQRRDAELKMYDLAMRAARPAPAALRDAPVLIDATWDNPNWWLRVSCVRAALGLASARETGLLDIHNAEACRATLSNLRIRETLNAASLRLVTPEWMEAARVHIATQGSAPDDVLAWKLPYGTDPKIVYDAILRRQKTATVRDDHPEFLNLVAECLAAINAARKIVDSADWRLLVMSHSQGALRGPLLQFAREKGIDCLVLYGHYGATHYYRIAEDWQLFEIYNTDRGDAWEAIYERHGAALGSAAMRYMRDRFSGSIDEESCQAAFGGDKATVTQARIRDQFGWTEDQPILAVYAPTWYEWPHYSEIFRYRDYLDWFEATLQGARNQRGAYWLWKSHPGADAIMAPEYAVDLQQVVPKRPDFAVVPDSWNGHAVMTACDGLVTLNGTGGLEAACLGKPVLVADRGWYGDCGFAVYPQSRDEYIRRLGENWWEEYRPEWQRRAQAFAGLFWAIPDWQAPIVLRRDSLLGELYPDLSDLLAGQVAIWNQEIGLLRKWYDSGQPRFNPFKIMSGTHSFVPLLRDAAPESRRVPTDEKEFSR